MQKSTARNVFLFGTVFFFLTFFGLSAHTMTTISDRTNGQDVTEEVAAGKKVWEKNNCVGCHIIIGEGAYYAPDVIKTYTTRGPEWLKAFLKDPVTTWYGNADMAQGQRKMPNFNLSDEDINNLIAFFEWMSRIDTNGWPPEPIGNLGASAGSPADILVKSKNCRSCHVVAGAGGMIGPSLDGVSQRLSAADITKVLKDPKSVNSKAIMPQLNLTDDEIKTLTDYLSTL